MINLAHPVTLKALSLLPQVIKLLKLIIFVSPLMYLAQNTNNENGKSKKARNQNIGQQNNGSKVLIIILIKVKSSRKHNMNSSVQVCSTVSINMAFVLANHRRYTLATVY